MTVKIVTIHNLEFLSLRQDCTGWSESTLVKMPYCWKSYVMAHLMLCSTEAFQMSKKNFFDESLMLVCAVSLVSCQLISVQSFRPFILDLALVMREL